jgi:hypothetical protein
MGQDLPSRHRAWVKKLDCRLFLRNARSRLCNANVCTPSRGARPDPRPTLIAIGLFEPQRKLPGGAGVEVDELCKLAGQLEPMDIPSPELGLEVIRHITRPSFAGVEDDHPERIVVLAGVMVVQRGFPIALRGIGLSVGPVHCHSGFSLTKVRECSRGFNVFASALDRAARTVPGIGPRRASRLRGARPSSHIRKPILQAVLKAAS